MTQATRLRRLLRDGPGTAAELAVESGLPIRVVSAVLCRLYARGSVKRAPQRRGREHVYQKHAPATPWTTRDVAALRGMAGRPAREVAAALGRSVVAVRHAASRNGVPLEARRDGPRAKGGRFVRPC